MRIIVIGSVKGDFDIVNSYIDKSKADIVLSTGDLGIFYRNEDFSKLPKSFNKNNFYEYLEGRKKFNKPVLTVRGTHDNFSLCKKLSNKDIKIENFTLISDGESVFVKNNTKDNIPLKKISIGGIGGNYSSKYYNHKKLTGHRKRHFTKSSVEKIKDTNILLMHDVIGEGSKKQVLFSDEMFSLIDESTPYYCFIGKYQWWGYSKIGQSNVVMLPQAEKGYMLIDTHDDWNAEAIRFDLDIEGAINATKQ